MGRAFLVVIAALVCACGGAPTASPKHEAQQHARARAIDAIDIDAPFRMGVDFAALRKMGWFEAVGKTLGGMASEYAPPELKKRCVFEMDRHAGVLEATRDERGEKLVSVELVKPIDNLDCVRAAMRASGWPHAELVDGLLLVGTKTAIDEAKRRLAQKRQTPSGNDGALVRVDVSDESAKTRFSMRVRGDKSKLIVRTELGFAPGEQQTEADLRKELDELVEDASADAAGEELKRALGSASIAATERGAVITVELRPVPKLGERLGKVLAGWTNSQKIAECNQLIEVINREQGPLKSASGSDPEALMKLADVLMHVAAQVSGVELEDAKLIAFRDAYADMARDLALASQKTSEALDANDPKRAADAARNMSSFGPRESQLVDAINIYCSGSK